MSSSKILSLSNTSEKTKTNTNKKTDSETLIETKSNTLSITNTSENTETFSMNETMSHSETQKNISTKSHSDTFENETEKTNTSEKTETITIINSKSKTYTKTVSIGTPPPLSTSTTSITTTSTLFVTSTTKSTYKPKTKTVTLLFNSMSTENLDKKKDNVVIINEEEVSSTGSYITSVLSVFTPPLISNVIRVRSISKLMTLDSCKRNGTEVPSSIESPFKLGFPEDSPSKYFYGTVIGNICFIMMISILYFLVCYAISYAINYFRKKSIYNEEKFILGKFLKDYYVADVINISVMGLMTPIFGSAIIFIGREDSEYIGLKVFIFIIVVVVIIGHFALMYKFILKRNDSLIDYRKNNQSTLIKRLLKEEGDWELKETGFDDSEKNKLYISIFLLASYKKGNDFFAFIDFCMVYLLAIPDIVANYVSAEFSCPINGIILCIILGLYFILLLWRKPIQPKLLLYATILSCGIQFSVCAAIISSQSDDVINSLSTLLVVTLYLPIVVPIILIVYNYFESESSLPKINSTIIQNQNDIPLLVVPETNQYNDIDI